jgi:WD40 repeat protein
VSQGSLLGHHDWISCLDWCPVGTEVDQHWLLALGSRDSKLCLWKFQHRAIAANVKALRLSGEPKIVIDDEDADDGFDDALYEDAARIMIQHNASLVTAVALEALLIGHDDKVTSVSWHLN